MNIYDIYRYNTRRNILIRGAVGMAVGVLFCAAYFAFTNQFQLSSVLIVVAVPAILTLINLRSSHREQMPGTEEKKKDKAAP